MLTTVHLRASGAAARAVAGALLAAGAARGALIESHWVSATSGLFSDAARWSTNPQAPNNGGGLQYHAILDASGPAYAVALLGSTTVSRLTVGAPATLIQGGALTVLEASTIDGAYQLTTGGALTAAGEVTVNGSVSFSGGTFGGAGGVRVLGSALWGDGAVVGGTLRTSAGASLTIHRTILPGPACSGLLELAGTTDWNEGPLIAQGLTVRNLAGGLFRANPGSLAGVLQLSDPTRQSVFDNAGALENRAGSTLKLEGAFFKNSGSVSLWDNTLQATNGGDHSGAFHLHGAGSFLDFQGEHVLRQGVTFDGEGAAGFDIIRLDGNVDFARVGSQEVKGAGTLRVTGHGDLANIRQGVSVVFEAGATGGAGGALGGMVDNYSSILFGDFAGGALHNRAGAVAIAAITTTGAGTLLNEGTLRFDREFLTFSGPAVTNTGRIEVLSGRATLGGAVTHRGEVFIAGGAELTLSGDVDFQQGAFVSGPGALIFGGASGSVHVTQGVSFSQVRFDGSGSAIGRVYDGAEFQCDGATFANGQHDFQSGLRAQSLLFANEAGVSGVVHTTGVTINTTSQVAVASIAAPQEWGSITLTRGVLRPASTIHLAQGLAWGGGEIRCEAPGSSLILDHGAVSTMSGTSANNYTGVLMNHGLLTMSFGNISLFGTFTNAADGEMRVGTAGLQGFNGGFYGVALLDNQGLLVKQGAGTAVAQNSEFSIHNSGTLRVDQGAWEPGHTFQNTGAIVVADGATLRPDTSVFTQAAGATMTGAGTVEFEKGAVSLAGSIAQTLHVRFTGATVSLQADEAFTGLLLGSGIVNGPGRLILTDPTLSSAAVVHTTLECHGQNINGIPSLSTDGVMEIAADGRLPFSGSAGSVGGFGGRLVNHGLIERTGSGLVTVGTGLTIDNPGAVVAQGAGLRFSGPVAQLVGTTLTGGSWSALAGGSIDFNGRTIRTNSGSVRLSGGASQFGALIGLSSNAGHLTIDGGLSLVLAPVGGELLNSGTITVGAFSQLRVAGIYVQFTQGITEIGVASRAAGGAGKLTDTATVQLGGTLRLALATEFAPAWGDSWTIMTWALHGGDFAQMLAPDLGPALRWWRVTGPVDMRVGVRAVADTNHDSVVDFLDLNNVLGTFGQSGAGLIGDADGNGLVDFVDLNWVVGAFGQHAPAPVPAPGALALACAGAWSVGVRRRRRVGPG